MPKPGYVSERDWALLVKYCNKYPPLKPELIVAIGKHETDWGKRGAGKEGYILGVGVYANGKKLASAKGLENQLNARISSTGKSWIDSLAMVMRANLYDDRAGLEAFADWVQKPADKAAWVTSVHIIYNKLLGHELLGGDIFPPKNLAPKDHETEEQAKKPAARGISGCKPGERPPWLDPEHKSFFTSIVNTNTEIGHSEVNPAKYSYEDIVNMMHYNQLMYGRTGRLVQAFPTFLMVFVDEGETSGGRKLWDNMYFYHSLMSISVVKDRSNPADTAFVEATNVYGGLNYYNLPKGIEELSFWQKVFPTITKQTTELRKRVFKDLMILPGARVHIRMGYGGCAALLPTVFNGTIVEMDNDEIMTFVAQGDGHELLNEMAIFDPEDKNNTFHIGIEPTSIIRHVMCKRGWQYHLNLNAIAHFLGWELDDVAKQFGNAYVFGAGSPFGIEHFGQVRRDNHELTMFGDDIKTWDVMMNVYPTTIDIGELNRLWHEYIASSKGGQKKAAETSGKKARKATAAQATPIPGGISGNFDAIGKAFSDLADNWRGNFAAMGNAFKGLPAEAKSNIEAMGKALADAEQTAFGERNIGIWLGNKTPWDVIKIIARTTDGYVPAVIPFQYRSSLFVGLPWWPACIKYQYNKNGKLTRVYTTLQQFYIFTSYSDILQNGIKASARDIITNASVIYTRGSKAVTTPTVFADISIRSDLQKTEVIDSGTVQDYIGPDGLFSWMGFEPGAEIALTYGISYLTEKLRDMYRGDLVVRGTGAVKPYDIFYMQDTYTNMNGLVEVGRVVHSLSAETGFTTTIKPDLIVRHKSVNEYWWTSMQALFVAGTYGALSATRVIKRLKAIATPYLISRAEMLRNSAVVRKAGGLFRGGIDALTNLLKLDTAAAAAEGAEAAAEAARAGRIARTVETVLKGLRSLAVGIEAGAAVVEAGEAAGGPPGWVMLAITVLLEIAVLGLIDKVITSIARFFDTMNVVKIYPMFFAGRPYVAGITGAQNLIAYGPWETVMYGEESGARQITAGSKGGIVMETVAGQSGQQPLPNGYYLTAPASRPGTITCTYDADGTKEGRKHHGLDLAFDPKDTLIRAVQAGVVTRAATGHSTYGSYVTIDHGDGVSSLYAHLSKIMVKQGQKVSAGMAIGVQGNTGLTRGKTGIHLHLELRINGKHVDPQKYLPPGCYGN